MPEWYFFVDKGRTKGPFERTQMDEAIRAGQVGPFDLIFKDGQEKWQPGHRFEEFQSLFSAETEEAEAPVWVVLARHESAKGIQFLQRGPFTGDKVKELLQRGEIRYSDYIWREGFGRWKRISALEVFNPPPVTWKPEHRMPHDVEIREASREELLDEVVTSTTIQPLEARPPEAVSENLTRVPEVPGSTHRRQVPRGAEGLRERRSVSMSHSAVAAPEPKKPRFLSLKLVSAMVLVGVIGFAFGYRAEIIEMVNRQRKGKETATQADTRRHGHSAPKVAEPAPAPKVAEPVPAPVAQTEPAPAPPPPVKTEPAPPPEPRRVPTHLELSLRGLKSDNPEVLFRTDGSSHYPLRALVVGEAGEILRRVNVYREVTVKRVVGERLVLQLKDLDLPPGQYRIEASIDDMETDREFFLGDNNDKFKVELERQRKLISLPFQRERRRLVAAASGLAVLGSRAKSEGSMNRGRVRDDLGNWSRKHLEGVSLGNAKNLVFPVQWLRLKELQGDLSKALERGVVTDELITRIRRVKEDAIQASLFR